jgi:hypothetical protein
MALGIDDLRRFVPLDHGLAIVSVGLPSGGVASSLVNAGVVDHPTTGAPVVAFVTRGDSRKLVHLRRDPRATAAWRAGWRWIAASGPVELVGPDDQGLGLSPDDLPALLRTVFAGAGGTHEDWDEFDRVMAAERRTAVLLQPASVYGQSG